MTQHRLTPEERARGGARSWASGLTPARAAVLARMTEAANARRAEVGLSPAQVEALKRGQNGKGRKLRLTPASLAARRATAAAHPITPEQRAKAGATMRTPEARERMRQNRLNRGQVGICVYCWGVADAYDHVVPPSRGGPDTAQNVVTVCTPCNSSKSDRTPEQWLADGLHGSGGGARQRERLP